MLALIALTPLRCEPLLIALEKIREAKKKVYEFRKKIAYPALVIGTPLCGYLDYLLITTPRSGDDGGAGIALEEQGRARGQRFGPKPGAVQRVSDELDGLVVLGHQIGITQHFFQIIEIEIDFLQDNIPIDH